MTMLNDLLERTGCAEELVVQPSTWEQLMRAVAAGAIDGDDVGEIALECTSLANQSEPNRNWEDQVIEALHALDGDITSESSQVLVACGKAADTWVQYGLN
jgi:hypothetical protein